MKTTRRTALLGGLALGLAGCASKFRTYDGPEVTRLQMFKGDRNLFLFNNTSVLKAYRIDLGFAPEGPKQFEGDGKTPEGAYTVDRRNPDSLFHLSIGISYPNEADIAFAAAQGREPGGDIFIHGGPRPGIDAIKPDWTAGCIAVSDREIEDIYAMVRDGTPIDIFA
ncbi:MULTISPECIES: murein L,D-transpeptidase family protein [Rhodobacterales]|nr:MULTISPECIES: L,D-transpeptidase family protein [Rhodobacterales]MBQ0802713.1 L,D-transpeptidase family protein [Sulfitobacter litoralis]MBW4975816.1 L,D-transpeptidase family protein [Roseovarius mucosus]MCF7748936.1 L,D-transpeptidase family protein [Sulfitobacter sp. M39]MCF7779604.1 L,D-transpeptidase family protein [Sulfitobacter sp. M220]UXX85393.1 L,D-transpeptidase family protein [Roseovarius pelagicus]